MEDIDRFIEKLKEEQEMKDYVEKDIYPERFFSDISFRSM